MNSCVLLGRLTRDPEVRYAQSGKVVCSFTLAVDRPYTDKETGKKECDFLPVVLWGKSAELAGNGLRKGARALVEGRIQVRNFTNKEGVKRYVTEIIADRFEFIERRESAGSGEKVPEPFDPFNDFGKEIDVGF